MIDVQELAREIAARMAPDALLDASDVAALLKVSPRYITEQYALSDGFPRAIRLDGPDGRKSKPRWRRSDIMRWLDSYSKPGKRTGRPRNPIE
jgi:predicted DNA-binding transcriptional regulator AlpA